MLNDISARVTEVYNFCPRNVVRIDEKLLKNRSTNRSLKFVGHSNDRNAARVWFPFHFPILFTQTYCPCVLYPMFLEFYERSVMQHDSAPKIEFGPGFPISYLVIHEDDDAVRNIV